MNADTGLTMRAVGLGRNTLKRRDRSFRGQEFDQYFFAKKFDEMGVVEEATTYLEIMNYTDEYSLVESQALRLGDDFDNFLAQKYSTRRKE
ncbi:Mg2+ transporter protein- CorA-like/Zinc transport protein ZntB [Apiospora kogelbergensis]|uniref:Mg2+ transporter protein- CorA-like/Zinc transport protein ZntB n=1 Tax=Apiospora kogelbergensis TaxID=1337665 RepID=A0AAW0RBG0_9PEZI